jgi:hypothetical protein
VWIIFSNSNKKAKQITLSSIYLGEAYFLQFIQEETFVKSFALLSGFLAGGRYAGVENHISIFLLCAFAIMQFSKLQDCNFTRKQDQKMFDF